MTVGVLPLPIPAQPEMADTAANTAMISDNFFMVPSQVRIPRKLLTIKVNADLMLQSGQHRDISESSEVRLGKSIMQRALFTIAFLVGALVLATGHASARSVVSDPGAGFGNILVVTGERSLYLGLGSGKAIRYRVGVGKTGRQWAGQRRIRSKHIRPAWQPTADIKRDKPSIADVIPGGAPNNPMGEAALVLSGTGQYAIHGTNNPRSIGGFVSYGCIRMHNHDVMDLYKRVRVGTRVTVVP